jgi:hypothetical protein
MESITFTLLKISVFSPSRIYFLFLGLLVFVQFNFYMHISQAAQATSVLIGPLLLVWNALFSKRALPRGAAVDEILVTPDGSRKIALAIKDSCNVNTAIACLLTLACCMVMFGFARHRYPVWYRNFRLSLIGIFTVWLMCWNFYLGRIGMAAAVKAFEPELAPSKKKSIIRLLAGTFCAVVAAVGTNLIFHD